MSKSKKPEWIQLGVVGVDSGQLLIVDPCYLSKLKSYDAILKARDFPGKIESFTQLHYDKGHVGLGTVFNSGLGDGVYKVYGKFRDCGVLGMRLAEVKIKMI
jgi:hypothetical protein